MCCQVKANQSRSTAVSIAMLTRYVPAEKKSVPAMMAYDFSLRSKGAAPCTVS